MSEFTPLSVAPAELARQLTLAGLEVESVVPVAPAFADVVVGEVLASGRHPDADKLSLCEVTTDGTNRLQIVCGAPNVRAGLKVAVALVGAKLPGGVNIRRSKIRGIESNGMLCSARELGLGEEHDGILELPGSLALNVNVREALDLDDTILEVNATPNRGDCMSVFGIARDYSAAQDHRYLEPKVVPVPASLADAFPVRIEHPGCPIFASRVIRGVKTNAKSPAWLRERLRRVGLNSISAVVDVTNYVMTELGQPMHAYDFKRLTGEIVVRQAKPEEHILLLDDTEQVLGPEFMVIADDSGPIGLAGIKGGKGTSIGDDTTDIVFEAAHFTPDAVAGRARRLGLLTDAAQRFERGVDPTLPALAMERATALLLQIAGGQAGPVRIARAPKGEAGEPGTRGAAPTQDAAAPDAREEWVSLRRARLERLLGAHIPDSEAREILAGISRRVESQPDGWRVLRPPHRFDVRIEEDLIEEVARLRGFDTIAEAHAIAPQIDGYATETRVPNDRLLTAMADRGYREAITYTFVDPTVQEILFPAAPKLALANPISADMGEMRVSLWSSLIPVCRENMRRQQSRVRLFEIGNKFDVSSGALREIETLAGVATGARSPEQWGLAHESLDFYDVKRDVETVLALTGDARSVRFEAQSLDCLHPGRSARIFRGDAAVGWIGELHPRLTKALNLSNTLFVFELEIASAFKANLLKFERISKFPSVRRDLAVVVDENVPLAVLRENVTVSASGLLSDLKVFDVYRGPNIDSRRKSVALGLILQDSSRTLTDDDADAVVASVVARLRDVLSATIRDQ
jgi:phenylalanyl-tRNA synthetase beta chain